MAPVTQAAEPPSCSTLTGAELPQMKKSCIYAHGVASVMSNSVTLWTVDCQASLSGGFSRQECWSVLANIGCHTLLLLLLLSHVSRVRLCATPEMAAHQAPPSLGFSRQEHWSGLPFPSPMHESEK